MTRSTSGWRDRFAVGLLAVLGLAVAALCVTLVLRPQALQTSAADVRGTAAAAPAAATPSPAASTIAVTPTTPTTPTTPATPTAPATQTDPAQTAGGGPTGSPSPTVTVSGTRSGATMTPTPGQDVVYVVQPGDSLWAIGQWFHARNLDSQWAAARSGLGGTNATLRPGQRILVTTVSDTGRSTD